MRAHLLRTLFILLLAPAAVWAQNGKISGTVTDRGTGEPLPGATVIIEGSDRGSAADLQGEYSILNVPPGTYTLRASFVGYGDQVVENVEVSSNFTTPVDFQLAEGVELEQVEVLAERLIRQDETATTVVMRGEDIQRLPVNSFAGAVSLAAGAVEANSGGDTGLHLRGGRSNEIAYFVDGVLVEDPFYGDLGGFDVARQSINELQILSGGFNAEYGQAMSGVILINTPTGGTNYHGAIRVQTDGYSMEGLGKGGPSAEYTRPFANDWGTRIFEASLSGPILSDRLTFFANFDRLDSDSYLNEFEGPLRPAVLPIDQLVGHTFLRSTGVLRDADGGTIEELDLAAIGLTQGAVITQEMLDQLTAEGVNLARSKLAVSDYRQHHQLGLYNDQTRLVTNLGMRVTRDLDARLSYKLTRNDYRSYDHDFKFLPQYNAPQRRNTDVLSGSVTHRVTPRVFYEARASYIDNLYQHFLYEEELDESDPYRFNRIFASGSSYIDGAFDTPGLSDAEGGSNYDFLGYVDGRIRLNNRNLMDGDLDRPYILGRDLDLDGDDRIDFFRGDRLTPELVQQLQALSPEQYTEVTGEDAFGVLPILTPPTDNYFEDTRSREFQTRFDVTAQLGNRNLVKAGFEGRFYDIDSYSVFANDDFDPTLDIADPNTLRQEPVDENSVQARPFQLAGYVQDKIEFSNVVVQLGLRYDMINTAVNNVLNLGTGGEVRRGAAESVEARNKGRLSPRLGVAFPVTDRARLSFSYGQFFQFPDFQRLYQSFRQNTWVPGQGYVPLQDFGFDLGFETFLGNPDLDPETTISYQLDGEFLVSEDMKLGATLFYKDIYDYVSLRRISGGGGQAYWVLANQDYANARGFEVRFEKRMSQHLGFNGAYTYSRAIGNADNYQERYNDWYNNSVLGIIPPKAAQPLDWDQPHTFSFAAQTRWQDLGVNFIGRFGSGLPYTPTSSRGVPIGPKNSARRPWNGSIDMRAEYEFEFGGSTYLRPFVEVTNLLDRRNVLNVYSDTGSPDFTLDPGTQFEAVQQIDYYGPPRHVEVGFQFGF